jgi:hypothetical protein
MNPDQVKSTIRWFLSTFGGLLVGLAAARGLPADSILQVLNSEFVVGAITSAIMLAWGMVVHKRAAQIVTASKDPAVTHMTINEPALAHEVAQTAQAQITSS